MTEKELKLSVKDPVGGYFFFGEEDYLKEYYTAQIRLAVIRDEDLASFNEISFDNDNFSAAALEEALLSPPVMADKKLIKVRLSSYSSLPEKEKKALLDVFSSIALFPDTVLAMSIAPDGFDGGTEKRPSAALKALEKHMKCVSFPMGQEAKLIRWLSRHFAKSNLNADEAALKLMINLCGRGMYRLAGEAEKVSARALSMGLSAVSCDIVSATVTVTPEEDAFMLANSVLAGNTSAALECLGRAKRRNENPIKLLASVTAVFCDLASIAHLVSEGADKSTIAKDLKLHEYKTGLYMKACSGISTEVLDEAVAMCAEADVKMKSTSLGYIPLERIICSAGRARKA